MTGEDEDCAGGQGEPEDEEETLVDAVAAEPSARSLYIINKSV